jgi:hypothetical protein
LMLALCLTECEILFFGDRLDPGGNDYPIKAMGIDCIEVQGWEDTISKVANALGDIVSSGVTSKNEFVRVPTENVPQYPGIKGPET